MENYEKPTEECFQTNLQKAVRKKMFLLIAIGCLLFSLGVVVMNYSVNQFNGKEHLKKLEAEYMGIYHNARGYLLNDANIALFQKVIYSEASPRTLIHSFYKFDIGSDVKTDFVFTDAAGNVIYTTFKNDAFNTHLNQFNTVVNENAKKSERSIYNAVYYLSGNYGSYIFAAPVYDEEEVIGYASIYLSGDEWNYHLSNFNFSSVITDEKGNTIISSRKDFIQQINKFTPLIENNLYNHEDNRYWVLKKELKDYKVIIYALIYYPHNPSYFLIGLFVIILLGLVWYQLAKQMTHAMAEKNASSINQLVKEIKIIRKKDSTHRIPADTKDEFSEVAFQINRMLDTAKELNERNTRLLELNNIIELKQLTAQFNPHFLYNTLETIRCLDFQDSDQLDKLIVRLTKILRYSIDNTCKDARLVEDILYIKDYLEIQKVRYGERFKFSIQMDKACEYLLVPKLLLQPVIENSIKYGFMKSMNIEIDIRIFMKEDILCLWVEDNGMGMTQEEEKRLVESLKHVENTSVHNGLHNIARRLYLSYGEGSRIELNNRPEEGLGIMIYIVS